MVKSMFWILLLTVLPHRMVARKDHIDVPVPAASIEKNLINELMHNYNLVGRGGRPVTNLSQTVMAEFGLGLIQIDLDEKNKLLSSSVWSRYKWSDEYLKWNPAQYGGLEKVRFPIQDIWRPDVMLYNTAETDSSERDVLAVVDHRGSVLWVPHQVFKSSCSIDVTNFPFDSQTCHMWFGSWTYSMSEIDLHLAFDKGIDLSTFMSDYKESCAWEIVNTTAERRLMPPENPKFVVLTFTLQIRRKVVFSSYILTLPCVFLASLTLVVFWLPPDRPDRTSLAMSLFASFLVLLLILVEAAPPTASSVPSLGIYYGFNMVIIMLSIFLSTLVVNVYRMGSAQVPCPGWLRWIMIDYLGKIMCLRVCRHKTADDDAIRCETQTQKAWRHVCKLEFHLASQLAVPITPLSTLPHQANQANNTTNSADVTNKCMRRTSVETPVVKSLKRDLDKLKSSLETLSGSVTGMEGRENERMRMVRDWREVASVLDRLFFFLYVAVITFSLIWLFPRRDNTPPR